MLAKKTSKNQITLPKEIAKAFPEAVYFDIRVENNEILLRPVRMVSTGSTLEGVREKMRKLGISENDVKDAVAWSRKSKSR